MTDASRAYGTGKVPAVPVPAADVVSLHDRYFNVFAEVFPRLNDLHYGLVPAGGGERFWWQRLAAGPERLLERVFDVCTMQTLPRGLRGLDVGSGLGGTMNALRQRFGHRMTGLNLNVRQAAMAARRWESPAKPSSGMAFVGGDGRRLPFASRTFDLVIMIEVAFHVRDKATLLTEAARVLRPGGHLILVDQEWRDPFEVLGFMFYAGFGDYRRLAGANGFAVVTEQDLGPEVAVWMRDYARGASPWFSWATAVSLLLRGRMALARRFARALTFFDGLIRADAAARGLPVADIPRWGAVQRMREFLADRLADGATRHLVLHLRREP